MIWFENDVEHLVEGRFLVDISRIPISFELIQLLVV